MSWNKRFHTEADLQPVNHMVTDTVRYFARDCKRDESIQKTATVFGVSPSTIWKIFYREPTATFSAGVGTAREKFLKHLEQRERDFELAAERTRLQRLEIERDDQ